MAWTHVNTDTRGGQGGGGGPRPLLDLPVLPCPVASGPGASRVTRIALCRGRGGDPAGLGGWQGSPTSRDRGGVTAHNEVFGKLQPFPAQQPQNSRRQSSLSWTKAAPSTQGPWEGVSAGPRRVQNQERRCRREARRPRHRGRAGPSPVGRGAVCKPATGKAAK